MPRVLVIGQGGREHALCWRLRTEGHEVHVAPGSAAMAEVAEIHPLTAPEAQVELARRLQVDLVVVGPEQPLVEGLADAMRAAGVATFGPSARAAELEASKAAAKRFMTEFAIPTARCEVVETLEQGRAALQRFSSPPVVKADGLAAGKGVTVCRSFEEAEEALGFCLAEQRFGAAGRRVVLEECLHGQEVSLFVITDGEHAAVLEPAQDHKRIGEGDTGPNTGGMGAYVPAPVFTDEVRRTTLDTIVRPTIAGLAEQGRPFVGVLFFGLMIEPGGRPMVIEYNCRFGDPETQPLMVGLEEPLYPLLWGAATGTLRDATVRGRPAATVVLASHGYPEAARSGDPITGLADAAAVPGVQVFHAGTRPSGDGGWETAGGRVLGVCASASSLGEALDRAYQAVDAIAFPGMLVRRDIGHRAR